MLLTEKYGGSSVSTFKKIKLVAKHIKKNVENNNKLIVVVSAMGKITNKLLTLSQKLSKTPNKREQDVLLCTGEMKTIALLSIALKELKVKAISLCGFQAKIKTSPDYGKAFIKDINISHIQRLLKTFDVIVVAGFQGIDKNGNLTTLGRGGSDTTAVALAAKLKCPCHIYTDVDCIFKANPNYVKNPKPLHQVDINTMLEMASVGAKVLDTRCLEIAKKFDVPIFLGKSLEEDKTKGSYVVMKKGFEEPVVQAICEKEELSLFMISKAQNSASTIFKILKKQNQNLNMFGLSKNTISFAVAKNDAENIEILLKKALKNAKIKVLNNFCEISVVGFGFSSHPQISEKMFEKLAKENIFATQIQLSETKISILLKQNDCRKTIDILTKLFEVSK